MIDCHAHLIPPAVVAQLRDQPRGHVLLTEEPDSYRFQFPRLPPSPPVPKSISDIGAAELWQRDRGIALQIFSPWSDLVGYTLDATAADGWTRALNEGMAAAVDGHASARALGSLSVQHPPIAARQIAHAVSLGLIGVMIGAATSDVALDDRALDVVWETLIRFDVPALIHPIFLAADPALQAYGLANVVGRSNVTTVATARLLLGGVLDRHPGLKLIIAHGGASIPFLLGRLQRAHELQPTDTSDPTAGFAQLYFDSVVVDPRVLNALLAIATPEQVLLGSDWPFPWSPDPGQCVRAANLAPAAERSITAGNARALFRFNLQGPATI